jgi:hypothetical protein
MPHPTSNEDQQVKSLNKCGSSLEFRAVEGFYGGGGVSDTAGAVNRGSRGAMLPLAL